MMFWCWFVHVLTLVGFFLFARVIRLLFCSLLVHITVFFLASALPFCFLVFAFCFTAGGECQGVHSSADPFHRRGNVCDYHCVAISTQTRPEELCELRMSVGNMSLLARQCLEDIFKRTERLLNAKCLLR